MPKKLKQAGDTIVEVIIAIAVLSLVIGIAYSLAIRSASTVQSAQQRNEAVQLAQSQVEFLRSYPIQHATTEPTFDSTHNVCFDTGGNPTPSSCNFPESSGSYGVTIVQASAGSDGWVLYTISVTWTHLLVGGQNNVTMYYEVTQ